MGRLRIHVKPGSRKGPLVETRADGVLVVYVRERAVDGAANGGAVAALAVHLGLPKRNLRIVTGHTARIKTVEVDDHARVVMVGDPATPPGRGPRRGSPGARARQ